MGGPSGSNRAGGCRYLPRESLHLLRPHRGTRVGDRDGGRPVSALPSGGASSPVLVPHWLTGADRAELADTIAGALAADTAHPVAAIHLEDVLTELHVAAARDAVWPASAERVRLVTGWDADVLPVRLSAAELAGVLALPTLRPVLRARLAGGAAR
jgi:hypothetical protein